MVARPRLLAPLVALLTACSSAPPAPPPQPPTTTPPADSAPADAGSGWTPVDPRIVRCGIDDRPRNVVSALPPREPGALLAEMAAPPPPAAGARAPRPMPSPMPVMPRRPPPLVPPITPPPDAVFDPGQPDLRIDPQPLASRTGTPVPASLSSVDPHYEICTSLAQESEPLGPVTFDLELASNGAPLRVLPPAGNATPSPLVRCLMERACQLQATASPPGQKTVLDVPLRLHRGEQAAAQPPPGQVADVRVDVATASPRSDRAELQLQLRSAAALAMRSCGAVPDRARVRLSLDLIEIPSLRRPRRARAPMQVRGQRVTGQRTENLEGTVPVAVLGCVVSAVSQRTYPSLGQSTATTAEQMILTWNP